MKRAEDTETSILQRLCSFLREMHLPADHSPARGGQAERHTYLSVLLLPDLLYVTLMGKLKENPEDATTG